MVSFIEHIAPKPVTSVEKYHTFKSLSKQAWPKCLWPILLFASLGKLFSGFFKILIRFSYLSIYWVSIKTYIFSLIRFCYHIRKVCLCILQCNICIVFKNRNYIFSLYSLCGCFILLVYHSNFVAFYEIKRSITWVLLSYGFCFSN